ncbi:MAG: hypothetical protein ACFFCZ_28290 [Promethearchaeota archaeon]
MLRQCGIELGIIGEVSIVIVRPIGIVDGSHGMIPFPTRTGVGILGVDQDRDRENFVG